MTGRQTATWLRGLGGCATPGAAGQPQPVAAGIASALRERAWPGVRSCCVTSQTTSRVPRRS